MSRIGWSLVVVALGLSCVANHVEAQSSAAKKNAPRRVLVELFTSQGCDMCPEAEQNLGKLGDTTAGVATLAFHVDYFNRPWKDVFSDKMHSERQASYNAIYTKPKNPEYGLYYTPMIMVDGLTTVNGRDPEGLRNAVRLARAKKPDVSIDADLVLGDDKRSGELSVSVGLRSQRVAGRDLVVASVLRDDRVVTDVKSGENANKSLVARFPARTTLYQFTRLDGKKESKNQFSLKLDPSWKSDKISVIIFVQDKMTGEIYQSALLAWNPAAGSTADTPKAGATEH